MDSYRRLAREAMTIVAGALVFLVLFGVVYVVEDDVIWMLAGVGLLAAVATAASVLLATLIFASSRAWAHREPARPPIPRRVLVTVVMPADAQMPRRDNPLATAELLAGAELAIDVFPESGQARVVKYRHGTTDLVEVDVRAVRAPIR